MKWYSPSKYIAFPFVVLWRFIREQHTTRKRVARVIVGLATFLFGVWVMFLWCETPTFVHTVYLGTIYSKVNWRLDSRIIASYDLSLTSNGYSSTLVPSDAGQFHENLYVSVSHDQPSRYKYSTKENINDFSDIVGAKAGAMLNEKCMKEGLSFNDFNYGYIMIHKYGQDFKRITKGLKVEALNETDYDHPTPKFANMICTTTEPFSTTPLGEIGENHSYELKKACRDDRYLQNSYSIVEFSNMLDEGFWDSRLNKTVLIAVIPECYVWRKMLEFYDGLKAFLRPTNLTKAKYTFYFISEELDSVQFNISFNEDVQFHILETSSLPIHKDFHTISFGMNYPHIAGNNVSFYVEFLESASKQYIRLALLTLILTFPFGMITRNIMAIIYNSSPSETHVAQPVVNYFITNVKRRHKKKKKK